ncbi:10169_t:CDS:2 [Paraglomus occultum]|uniref:phosphoribosylglycinamide formyltransferase 1 n=1 Tax=Paraglomus occultum TaxID=144539 RepID=A0A9N9GPS5_9GLOM|nr:10169_t:CDS:2 [Paraglomus occultum]
MLPRIVVLISGYGSNLQALIDATKNGTLKATITLVVSSKPHCIWFKACRSSKHPYFSVSATSIQGRGEITNRIRYRLGCKIKAYEPDLIVLAGWVLILSSEFLDHFAPKNVINLHPALPGQFNGTDAIRRAYEAYKRGEIQKTGVMVHKVIPEVDSGELIVSEEVAILETDTLNDLQTRIHSVEHRLIVAGANKILHELNHLVKKYNLVLLDRISSRYADEWNGWMLIKTYKFVGPGKGEHEPYRQKSGREKVYDRHCLHLTAKEIDENISQGLPYTIRLKVPDDDLQ